MKRYAEYLGIPGYAAYGTHSVLSTRMSDSSPASKASDEFVFIPDVPSACELCSNRVELVASFFFQLVYPARISTHCRVTVSLDILLSQQRSSLHQITDVFSRVMVPSLKPTGPDA